MGKLHAQNCPMYEGIMEIHHYSPIAYFHPTEGVSIYSNNKEVSSISDGTVLSIINLSGDTKAVLIKQGIMGEEDYYYIYSNLESTYLQKGDWVQIGDLIGHANSNKDRFEFEFQHRTKDEIFNPVGILNCKIANIYH
jgi:septal ring factor EnvC (AmiA/AmiB activator)